MPTNVEENSYSSDVQSGVVTYIRSLCTNIQIAYEKVLGIRMTTFQVVHHTEESMLITPRLGTAYIGRHLNVSLIPLVISKCYVLCYEMEWQGNDIFTIVVASSFLLLLDMSLFHFVSPPSPAPSERSRFNVSAKYLTQPSSSSRRLAMASSIAMTLIAHFHHSWSTLLQGRRDWPTPCHRVPWRRPTTLIQTSYIKIMCSSNNLKNLFRSMCRNNLKNLCMSMLITIIIQLVMSSPYLWISMHTTNAS